MEIQPKEDLHKSCPVMEDGAVKMCSTEKLYLPSNPAAVLIPGFQAEEEAAAGRSPAAAPDLSGQNINPTQGGFSNR